MSAWVGWAIAAVLLAVGELLTPGLFFLGPVALAAVVAMVVAMLGGAVWLQLALFAAASLASLTVLRPIARAHLTMPAPFAPAQPRSRAHTPSSSSAWTGSLVSSAARSGRPAHTCRTRRTSRVRRSKS